jgi:hypothetical protein
MKTDPILEEVWRVKDKLSREMAADPAAYSAKLDEIANAEEKAGRKVIRSAAGLRELVAERGTGRAIRVCVERQAQSLNQCWRRTRLQPEPNRPFRAWPAKTA